MTAETQKEQNPGATQAQPNTTKLPKLELKKFYGDPCKWPTFWDCFSTAIDKKTNLPDVDKFNYLKGLLEGSAAATISGLALTSENYKNAVELLRNRFGNEQVIINSHMNALMNMTSLKSASDLKALRKFYDDIEAHVRGLESMKVLKQEYGSMMISVLMAKLPDDLKLLIGRKLEGKEWSLAEILNVLRNELETRERCGLQQSPSTSKTTSASSAQRSIRNTPTASALFSSNQQTEREERKVPKCTYCKGNHASKDCQIVTNISARKQALIKEGRCFLCLRKNHLARDCESNNKCFKCSRHHHISICDATKDNKTSREQSDAVKSTSTPVSTTQTYVSTSNSVLLQTAQAKIYKDQSSEGIPIKILFDSGSQKSYIAERARNALQLETVSKQTMLINSFGQESQNVKECESVEFDVRSMDGDFSLTMNSLVVPTICSPIHYQDIAYATEQYSHLQGIELADKRENTDSTEVRVDLLIGADFLWKFFTGEVKRGEQGPVATRTTLGWVLSGPINLNVSEDRLSSVNFVNTHVLRVGVESVPEKKFRFQDAETLGQKVGRLWDLDSVGIRERQSVCETFEENIAIARGRYTVPLPFKEHHKILPDNYELSLVRLNRLVKRLKREPKILQEYDDIIQEQISSGIAEKVPNSEYCIPGTVHYIPHQPVLRKDAVTTKLRVVYDASAKVNKETASLNECLYTGPSLMPHILDVLLRFRGWKYGIVSDVEKAFLQIAVQEEHRNYLRFLWVSGVDEDDPEIMTLRFARVIFGVNASPFLLNATLHHHIKEYYQNNAKLAKKIIESLYVDDLSVGANTISEGHELYKTAKDCFKKGKFNLRKWRSNNSELMNLIKADCSEDVEAPRPQTAQEEVMQDDQSYTKQSVGNLDVDEGEEHKVLGVPWNCTSDTLLIKLKNLSELGTSFVPTKRNLIKIYSKLFDPLGLLSPMLVKLKVLFQELCSMKIGWDDVIPDEAQRHLRKWVADLEKVESISVPRYYFAQVEGSVKSVKLIGFGDSSRKCYACVIYLLAVTDTGNFVSLVASKTRIAPLTSLSIPRLELLAALILARLISTVRTALESVVAIESTVCFTDSLTVLYWIVGGKELKQFSQNRVNEILKLTDREQWRHCPGIQNPADIGSRGLLPSELLNNELWWKGPQWLREPESEWPNSGLEEVGPTEESETEMKNVKPSSVNVSTADECKEALNVILPCEKFRDIGHLLRVTAYVLRFINNLKAKRQPNKFKELCEELTVAELARAEHLWILEMQAVLPRSVPNYESLKKQLGLYVDDDRVIRCRGRFSKSSLPYETKYPALIPRNHPVAKLIVQDCHEKVLHAGVKDTLNELRTRFWIVKGRQYVRLVLYRCNVCRKLEGVSYTVPRQPDLPQFRVCETKAFDKVGCDLAGPLFIRTKEGGSSKVYICLFTCTASRAVHLEVLPDLSCQAFIRALDRFTSRRGIPQLIVSDNAKNFKAASKLLNKIFKERNVQKYMTSKNITWHFILQAAPWWGGFYERLIGLVKRSLKKVLGQACVGYEELLTVTTNIEATLNSRPLTYLHTDEHEEPLCPSHLVTGRRILSLPSLSEKTELEESTLKHAEKRMTYLNTLLQHFWQRWSKEYLLNLREFHNCGEKRTREGHVAVGDVVLVQEQGLPRQSWRMGVVEKLITSADGKTRGATVKTMTKKGRPSRLNRPIQKLFPVELAQQRDNRPPLRRSSRIAARRV